MAFEMGILGDFIRVQGGFAYKSQDFSSTGKNPVLKIKNVRFGVIDYSDTEFVSDELASQTENWATREGDVLISMTGSGPNAPQSLVGRVARVWENEPKSWINQRVGRLQLKTENAIDLDFVFYLLSLPQSQEFLVSNSTGSANQANISAKIIELLPCPKISYDQSKNIADIFKSLDRKIILNRQINQTLEQMAQTLFKSWFVDFDPVIDNALDAGNDIPDTLQERAEQRRLLRAKADFKPLPAETRALFPSEFEETKLGWVPKGWEVRPAEEIAEISIGKTPPRSETHWFSVYRDENIPWISIRDMGICGVFINESSEYLTPDSIEKFNIKVVPKGSVLLSFKLTVGRVAIANQSLATNEAIAHFVNPKYGINKEYIYCYLSIFDYESLGSTSSIASAVNSKIIKQMNFIVPSSDVSHAFKARVSHLFEKINLLSCEIQTLTSTRDLLLPELISGNLSLLAMDAAE